MKRETIEAMKVSIANQIDIAEQELCIAEEEVRMYESQLEDLDEALDRINTMVADDD